MGFEYNINEVRALGEVLEAQAAKYGDKTFLFWKDEEVSYTGILPIAFLTFLLSFLCFHSPCVQLLKYIFSEFNNRVNQVANALVAAGVQHENKVSFKH